MRPPCENCQSTLYARQQAVVVEGKTHWACSDCSKLNAVWLPDVFLGAEGGIKTDPNLVDPKTGKEMPFSTKREKAAIMRYLNLRQADSAEHSHGSRNEVKRKKYFI